MHFLEFLSNSFKFIIFIMSILSTFSKELLFDILGSRQWPFLVHNDVSITRMNSLVAPMNNNLGYNSLPLSSYSPPKGSVDTDALSPHDYPTTISEVTNITQYNAILLDKFVKISLLHFYWPYFFIILNCLLLPMILLDCY